MSLSKKGVCPHFFAFLASGFFLSHAFNLGTQYLIQRIKYCVPLRGRGCGLVGTFWGMLFWWIAPKMPPHYWIAIILVLGFLSAKIAFQAENYYGKKDDPRIVIDEFMGYLCSVFACPKTLPVLLGGAFLFRVFDVWKPGPIKSLERLPRGWGCVLDDIASGLLAQAFVLLFVGFD